MKLVNKNFPEYMDVPMMNIPSEDMDAMLMELAINAMFFMNTENSEDINLKLVAGIKDLILSDYNYKFMPLHLVIETFHKGSVGELGGTTRFGLRNVNLWLFSSKEKHQKLIAEQKSKEDNRKRAEWEENFKRNHEKDWIFGQALWLKVGWNYSGAIKPQDWDKYTLDAIVEKLRQGYDENSLRPSMILK
jgi:hypothetical protein